MKLLVTDLDNTLYDWVTPFARSIRALVRELAPIVQVSEDVVYRELKTVHRRHHNSEHPFACFELPSVRKRFPGATPAELQDALSTPLGAFDGARATWLRVYDGVPEALDALVREGVVIVAHTEAIGPVARSRLRKLGLLPWFSGIYAIGATLPPHPDPDHEPREDVPLHAIPREHRKPNPGVLRDICAAECARPAQVVYVGDSLVRDIYMARRANICAVWARYGQGFSEDDWATVVRVSHWTAEDVRRERQFRAIAADVRPDFTIERFEELLPIVAGVGARRVARRRAARAVG